MLLFSPWTAWSDFSTTCGMDIQKQTINDCNVQVDRKVCTNIVVLSEWSEWGACSAECGNGLMVRERNDPCNRREEQMTKCRVRDCPYYGMWSAWSECAVSCHMSHVVLDLFQDLEHATMVSLVSIA